MVLEVLGLAECLELVTCFWTKFRGFGGLSALLVGDLVCRTSSMLRQEEVSQLYPCEPMPQSL